MAKFTVTVSPGSITLLVGRQLSNTSALESSTTTGLLFTKTVNVLVALNGGMPSSITRVVMILVLRSCPEVGVHVITPLAAIVALVGADRNE